MSLSPLFALLEGITGRKAPRVRVPIWMAMAAGYLDELVEGKILRREPVIPVEGLRVSRKPMYVSCQKAVTQLGIPQSPVEGALEKAVRWFRDHGYDAR
jgi:dihydroflavonol-4-reductase